MIALTWIAFAWGAFTALVTGYFTTRWLVETPNPLHHELLMGSAMGLVMGFPAWLALLPMVYFMRHKFSTAKKWVLLSPVAAAATTLALLALAGGL
jgi:riboflavin transporter FmnP